MIESSNVKTDIKFSRIELVQQVGFKLSRTNTIHQIHGLFHCTAVVDAWTFFYTVQM